MILAAILASAIDCERLQHQFSIMPYDEAIVADAVARWSKFNNGRGTMEGRVPVVYWAFGERCVQLQLIVPALGGTPTYCYNQRDDTFTRADERVE